MKIHEKRNSIQGRRSRRDKYAPNKFCADVEADVEAKPVLYSSLPPPDFETFRRLW